MYKLVVFFALLACALSGPAPKPAAKPGLLAAAPVAYTAGYVAAPSVAAYSAYSSPLAYSSYGYPYAYSSYSAYSPYSAYSAYSAPLIYG